MAKKKTEMVAEDGTVEMVVAHGSVSGMKVGEIVKVPMVNLADFVAQGVVCTVEEWSELEGDPTVKRMLKAGKLATVKLQLAALKKVKASEAAEPESEMQPEA